MTMQADPQLGQRLVYVARGMLTAKENEQAQQDALERWAELQQQADMALLEQGFGLFQQAEPQDQWQAFRDFTMMEDLYRCLLSDYYVEEYLDGRQGPPVSPLWNDLLLVGGVEIYEYFRKKFIRLWNRVVKEMGVPELQKPAEQRPY